MSMSFDLKADMSALNQYKVLLEGFPKALQRACANHLDGMAIEFRAKAVEAIDSKYTIRDRNFVTNKAFKIVYARASSSIEKQHASVASVRIESSSAGLFTGWEEEITGAPREMRAKGGRTHRQVWSNARKSNSVYGLMMGQYKLRTQSDKIPDSADYGLPVKSFLAMLHKSMQKRKVLGDYTTTFYDENGKLKRKKYKIYSKEPKRLLGKNKVFIMEDGGKHPRGLYTFNKDGKVKALQTFNETPTLKAEKWDWRGEAVENVLEKYTPDFVIAHHILPLLKQLKYGGTWYA